MDSKISPVYLLRSYAWAVLKANDSELWNEQNYDGLVPIVPLNEEPEIVEFGRPYLVYGYAIDSTGSLYARKSGSLTFAIYDTNFRRLTDTLNILQTAFERQDESATDINNYTSLIPGFVGINFGYTSVSFAEGGSPEESEGGNQSALINIAFEYYTDYDVVTNVTP